MVVYLRCLLYHILSLIAYTFRENWDFVSIIIVQFMMSANSRIRSGLLTVFVCLFITLSHYHHCANLSEDIELIKCLSDIYLSSVWVRLSIFSQLSIIQYMGLCVFSLPISLMMIKIIYTLSYYHHQIGSMNCYPLFRVGSWDNDRRCICLYIPLDRHICPWRSNDFRQLFEQVCFANKHYIHICCDNIGVLCNQL